MKVVIDARTIATHPMELDMQPGVGILLQHIAIAMKEAGHSTNVILGGGTEAFQNGISYWPQSMYPHSCDVLITPGKTPAPDIRAAKVFAGSDLFAIPPGIDRPEKIQKVPHSMIWMAGANRGLWHLAHIWADLKREIPDISLVIGHDLITYVETMYWQHDFQGLMALDIKDWAEAEDGVTVLAKEDRRAILTHQWSSELCVYPCDPLIADKAHRSLSTYEAAGAGCALLLSPSERLYDDFEHGAAFIETPSEYGTWTDTIIQWMKDDSIRKSWQEKARASVKGLSWERFHRTWSKEVLGNGRTLAS